MRFNLGFVASGFGRSFDISPAVEGKTTWSLDADGPMVLSTAGTWTFTPHAGFSGTVSIWGGGGGRGSQAQNDGGATTFAGLTANGGGRGVSGTAGGTASGGTTNISGTAGQIQSSGSGGRGGGAGNGGGNVPGGSPGQFAAEASVPGGGGPGHGGDPAGGAGASGGGYSTRAYAVSELTVGSPITITVGAHGVSSDENLGGGRPGKPGRFRVE